MKNTVGSNETHAKCSKIITSPWPQGTEREGKLMFEEGILSSPSSFLSIHTCSFICQAEET